jgi:hypothetical protein
VNAYHRKFKDFIKHFYRSATIWGHTAQKIFFPRTYRTPYCEYGRGVGLSPGGPCRRLPR